MYCTGDERKDLIPSFVAWIDVSGNLLIEGLVEVFGEVVFADGTGM